MLLTGQALNEFYQWLYKTHRVRISDVEQFDFENKLIMNALIIEWFDSVNIFISIEPKRIIDVFVFDVLINEELNSVWATRIQATEQAIIKANEIYNNLNK